MRTRPLLFLVSTLAVATPVAAQATPQTTTKTASVALCAAASCTSEFSPDWSFELGGTLGNPMGVDMKYNLVAGLALKSVIGATFSKDVLVNLDFLLLDLSLLEDDPFDLNLFAGIGAVIGSQDTYDAFTTAVGVPIGVDLPLNDSPWILSLLVRPGVALAPETAFSFTWHFGIRYNFARAEHLDEQRRRIANKAEGYFNDLTAANKGLKKARGELSDTQDDLDNVNTKLGETEQELNAKAKVIEAREQDLARIKEEQEAQKKALAAAEEALTNNEARRTELQDQVKALESGAQSEADPKEINALKAQLEALQSEKQDLQTDQRRDTCAASGGTFSSGRCNCPDGRVSKSDVCVCPNNREVWAGSRNSCICSKGFYRNAGQCKPCRYLKANGYCRSSGCTAQERRVKVDTRDGIQVYKCVARCTKENQVWSSRSKACICQDGYRLVDGVCRARN